MAKQIVEELIGVLGLDVDDASFKKGNRALGDTGVSFTKVAAMATAAATAIQAAISGMVLSFADSADSAGKFASRIGVTVEGLTSLRHAVEQTSTATEQQFNTGLQRMTRRISEANAGSKGLVDGLRELGLEASVLAKMAPDEQFLAMADAMKEVTNSGDQTRLTMKFFDSEAVELVNTLRLGSDAIREFQKEAKLLGIVLSEDDAKAAAEFNDQMDIARKSIGGLTNEIGRNLLPVFTELAVSFSKFVKDNKELIQGGLLRFFELFAFALKAAAVAAGVFVAFKLGTTIIGIATAMRGLTLAAWSFNAAALFMPILIAAFAGALFLIGNEIATFINHGEKADTFLGRFAKNSPKAKAALDLWLAPIKALGLVLGQLAGFLVQIANTGDIQSAWDSLDISTGLIKQFDDVLAAWNRLTSGFGASIRVQLGLPELDSDTVSVSSILGSAFDTSKLMVDALAGKIYDMKKNLIDAIVPVDISLPATTAAVAFDGIQQGLQAVQPFVVDDMFAGIVLPDVFAGVGMPSDLFDNSGSAQSIINNSFASPAPSVTNNHGGETNIVNNISIDATGMDRKELDEFIDIRTRQNNAESTKVNSTRKAF